MQYKVIADNLKEFLIQKFGDEPADLVAEATAYETVRILANIKDQARASALIATMILAYEKTTGQEIGEKVLALVELGRRIFDENRPQ